MRICANIAQALREHSARRVLVVFGLDHKYSLDDCIAHLGARSLEVQQWFADGAAKPPVDGEVKRAALANIELARALLRSRLASGVYDARREKFMKKEASFDRWIEAVLAL